MTTGMYSSCDWSVSFSRVIWISCTKRSSKSSAESNLPVEESVVLRRQRTRERRHRQWRKRLLNEKPSRPGLRSLRNLEQIRQQEVRQIPTSFDPAMKPECFFICGSSCSGQQIRWKILLFEDNFILKTRKTDNVPNKFGFSGFPDKKHSGSVFFYGF